MAGDWIKMRTALLDDPAVIAIGEATHLDAAGVIGRLFIIWSWADQQSRDGHADGVTCSWINNKVHSEGFAEAMEKCAWLKVSARGITFPNFDRHNGKPAKERALATRRKQDQRSRNGHGDVAKVSRHYLGPEKRREDIPVASSISVQPVPAATSNSDPPQTAVDLNTEASKWQVHDAKPDHALITRWAAEGITPRQLAKALEIARSEGRKPLPERLTLAYVNPILAEIVEGERKSKAAGDRRVDSTQQLLAKQREWQPKPMPENLKPAPHTAKTFEEFDP